MCGVCRDSTIDGVVIRLQGRSSMLQWKPRLVVAAAIITLLLPALGGGFFEAFQVRNLYW
jgi:hypothetical protein